METLYKQPASLLSLLSPLASLDMIPILVYRDVCFCSPANNAFRERTAAIVKDKSHCSSLEASDHGHPLSNPATDS